MTNPHEAQSVYELGMRGDYSGLVHAVKSAVDEWNSYVSFLTFELRTSDPYNKLAQMRSKSLKLDSVYVAEKAMKGMDPDDLQAVSAKFALIYYALKDNIGESRHKDNEDPFEYMRRRKKHLDSVIQGGHSIVKGIRSDGHDISDAMREACYMIHDVVRLIPVKGSPYPARTLELQLFNDNSENLARRGFDFYCLLVRWMAMEHEFNGRFSRNLHYRQVQSWKREYHIGSPSTKKNVKQEMQHCIAELRKKLSH
ncbi:hypothetical protein GF351_00010 [Candidatus Woesearchaeota archaeon]|nr:hypothetical protein [Candidatus Woesearchaeota archaeon]